MHRVFYIFLIGYMQQTGNLERVDCVRVSWSSSANHMSSHHQGHDHDALSTKAHENLTNLNQISRQLFCGSSYAVITVVHAGWSACIWFQDSLPSGTTCAIFDFNFFV
jgi:hypothetical protein